jgi:hypothetical protein
MEGFEGVSQYRRPKDFELTGQSFYLALDNGKDFLLQLVTAETLQYVYEGITEQQLYECMKIKDAIFLIHFERKNQKPRKAVTIVIDLGTKLVTVNFATQGANIDNPRLVEREIIFGVVRCPGKVLPTKRHEYTDELVGKKIEWTYNPEFSIVHIYNGKDRYRGGMLNKKEEKENDALKTVFEEPAIYIKISDRVYIFSWIEKNTKGGTMGFMLMDEARLIDIGIFFGINPKGMPESYAVSAYGKYITETMPEELMESPFQYN